VGSLPFLKERRNEAPIKRRKFNYDAFNVFGSIQFKSSPIKDGRNRE